MPTTPPLNLEAKRAADRLWTLIGGTETRHGTRAEQILETLASFLSCVGDDLPADGSEPDGLANTIGGLVRGVLGDLDRSAPEHPAAPIGGAPLAEVRAYSTGRAWKCDPNCKGYFRNAETGLIERCDECATENKVRFLDADFLPLAYFPTLGDDRRVEVMQIDAEHGSVQVAAGFLVGFTFLRRTNEDGDPYHVERAVVQIDGGGWDGLIVVKPKLVRPERRATYRTTFPQWSSRSAIRGEIGTLAQITRGCSYTRADVDALDALTVGGTASIQDDDGTITVERLS